MSGWRLVPGEIEGVLGRVAATQSDLCEVHGGDVAESVLGGLAVSSSVTRPVYGAASDLVDALVVAVRSLAGRVDAGLVGVANATAAYQMGSEEMATVFQAAAGGAATSGDLSYFERYGVL